MFIEHTCTEEPDGEVSGSRRVAIAVCYHARYQEAPDSVGFTLATGKGLLHNNVHHLTEQ